MSTELGGIRRRFSIRFIKALKRISRRRRGINDFSRRRQRQYMMMIKKAAYVSMASAVGPRWTWARAALKWRLMKPRARFIMSSRAWLRKKRMGMRDDDKVVIEVLKRLVPGGGRGEDCMDIYKLLGETAHYIKCLSTQVQVMRSIADHLKLTAGYN